MSVQEKYQFKQKLLYLFQEIRVLYKNELFVYRRNYILNRT